MQASQSSYGKRTTFDPGAAHISITYQLDSRQMNFRQSIHKICLETGTYHMMRFHIHEQWGKHANRFLARYVTLFGKKKRQTLYQ